VLHDLKRRTNRKLAVIDGEVALVGGRNQSHEHSARSDEARLAERLHSREVSRLDAGARVERPAVAELDRSFLDGAGGHAFDPAQPSPAGTVGARVAMIETAQSHLSWRSSTRWRAPFAAV
jgi:phosphatidylserine/phosphatidylglycerophosphate/cardiolipin synthase-like enzyme